MPFFNATTEKGKAKVSAMQDFVDGLEANGIPVPEHVRSELDYYNNILVRGIARDNFNEALEDPAFANEYEDPELMSKATINKKRVGHAKDVMMNDAPSRDEDPWVSSFDDSSIDGIDTKVKLKLKGKSK